VCLIIFAYRANPDYHLILAANRDEFYDRATCPAAFWDDAPEVLAGRDLRAGGTWLGITKKGRIAAITNYREPGFTLEGAPSRGDLVKDFLTGDSSPYTYLKRVHGKNRAYSGFNLIIGDRKDLFYYSNRDEHIRRIEPGVHGLSNHLLDTAWPKVSQGKSELQSLITQNGGFFQKDLFKLLADHSSPLDEELPDTGVGLEWERILSPRFITSDVYGTRSSSIVAWRYNGEVTFLERTFQGETTDPLQADTRKYSLTLPASPGLPPDIS
jgi:uncharacterized protein with NRDE domain